jgi:hypothetical protein
MLDYLAALGSVAGRLSGAMVSKQEVNEKDPNRPLRFLFEALLEATAACAAPTPGGPGRGSASERPAALRRSLAAARRSSGCIGMVPGGCCSPAPWRAPAGLRRGRPPAAGTELAARLRVPRRTAGTAANSQEPPTRQRLPPLLRISHYAGFQGHTGQDDEVLPSIKAILDAAARHHLLATRAEYLRAADAHAQAARLQMTVPVKGVIRTSGAGSRRSSRTQPHLALNELGFKREEIGLSQDRSQGSADHLAPAAAPGRTPPMLA